MSESRKNRRSPGRNRSDKSFVPSIAIASIGAWQSRQMITFKPLDLLLLFASIILPLGIHHVNYLTLSKLFGDSKTNEALVCCDHLNANPQVPEMGCPVGGVGPHAIKHEIFYENCLHQSQDLHPLLRV